MKNVFRLLLLLALPALACGPLAATGSTALPPTAPLPTPRLSTVAPTATGARIVPVVPSDTPIPPVEETPSPTPALVPAPFDAAKHQWKLVADGFRRPLYVTHAGDGSGRLFVVEQSGAIRIVVNGSALQQPFLDLTGQVSGGNEQGLLGLAFHPDYPNTPYLYVDYTDLNGDTHVVRYNLSADPNVADAGSAQTVLEQAQPYANHNGGDLVFGPDGYLYVGLGDGGSAGDPQGNGQNVNVWLGKILRLDMDGGEPYAIPADNPFAGGGGRPEIWAYGLRNPWRFSFDRATGDLYIADVGQGDYEEVDFQPAGSPGGVNYEWSLMEGLHPFQGNSAPPGGTPPVVEYSHADGCSVTGGYVYRGGALPEVSGMYFYGDYCSGKIWTLARDASGAWQSQLAYESGFSISSFGEDESGELYVVDHGGGIYRLEAAQ